MGQIVIYESTPNPHSMKFVVTDRLISSETAHFSSAQTTLRSPLARKLFGFPWAAGVYIGPNFVTVSKQDWVDWSVLAEPLAHLIEEHILRGEKVLLPLEETSAILDDQKNNNHNHGQAQELTPLETQVRHIIETEIRPAVAMDGGDIIFDSIKDGHVYLHMQGSCSGCPSATLTLKDGIESRLQQAFPDEIIAVHAL